MTTAKNDVLVRYNNFLAVRGTPPIPIRREDPTNMWSLTNLKIARKSHPHHSMTSVFLFFVEQGGKYYTKVRLLIHQSYGLCTVR